MRIQWATWLKRGLAAAVVGYLVLNGFAGYKDIDKRSFVVSIGIDEGKSKPDHFLVTLKIAIPGPDPKQGDSNFLLISEEATGIAEAVRKIKARIDKEPDFGQMKVIMVGEQLARSRDINEIMDWFERRRDIQKIAWVSVGTPDAKAILAVKPKTERLAGNAMFLQFGREGTESPFITSTYLFEFRRSLQTAGADAFMPLLQVKKEASTDELEASRLALFHHNKLHKLLNDRDTHTFNMVRKHGERTGITVSNDGETFMLTFDQTNFKYDVSWPPASRPKLIISAELHGIVEESTIPVTTEKLLEIEKLAEEQFRADVKHLLQTLQKDHIDPIGFGLRSRAKYGRFDEEAWDDEFARAETEISVRVRLIGTGIKQ